MVPAVTLAAVVLSVIATKAPLVATSPAGIGTDPPLLLPSIPIAAVKSSPAALSKSAISPAMPRAPVGLTAADNGNTSLSVVASVSFANTGRAVASPVGMIYAPVSSTRDTRAAPQSEPAALTALPSVVVLGSAEPSMSLASSTDMRPLVPSPVAMVSPCTINGVLAPFSVTGIVYWIPNNDAVGLTASSSALTVAKAEPSKSCEL